MSPWLGDDGPSIPSPPPSRVRAIARETSRGAIIGASTALVDVLADVERVARASCSVLITGESGTGKELIVAALHDASPRAGKPLVALNCGAIPEALMEADLFGHTKGAFTGAVTARQGRVAAAEGGTLFLDEIGEMPLNLQVKLLRLLQQREYSPVGDSKTVRANVRVVAATNRDLEQEVKAGRFREDLYYRLNVIHLRVPALRERSGDVPRLLNHFLSTRRTELGRDDLTGFTDEAMALLESYRWPGNVRELENVVERCVLLGAGPLITARDIPFATRAPDSTPANKTVAALPDAGIDLRAAVEEFESNLVRQALARTNGNKNRAAQLLGLNRTTLVEMVKRKQLAG
ncbi:MAG: sigma-54 dependent transcriptional regulator [Polyangiaceae bacterium]